LGHDDVDAVVEVLAETAGLDLVGEVEVAGQDDADVGGAGLVAADGLVLLFLQDAEELDLEAGRGGGDFVEEDGAALGGLELARRVKAPLTWPKSSLSRSVSGMAPQETSTKGLSRRWLRWWTARAMRDFPVPDSPWIRTVVLVSATISMRSKTLSMR
jgi:hypothetical protein